jgi:hypothetical protein
VLTKCLKNDCIVVPGWQDVVSRLLAAGADPRLTVGGLSVVDIDREMGKCSLSDILQQYCKE